MLSSLYACLPASIVHVGLVQSRSCMRTDTSVVYYIQQKLAIQWWNQAFGFLATAGRLQTAVLGDLQNANMYLKTQRKLPAGRSQQRSNVESSLVVIYIK